MLECLPSHPPGHTSVEEWCGTKRRGMPAPLEAWPVLITGTKVQPTAGMEAVLGPLRGVPQPPSQQN
jgi:hypothetical protein